MSFRLLAFLVLGLVAAGPASSETLIRIGYPGTGLDGRPYSYGQYAAVAHVQRLVEQEFKDRPDVTVSWTFFRGAGPALNEALAAGQLDVAAGLGDLPAIVGRSHGLDTRFLAAVERHDPIYLAVPPGSAIASVEELHGRRVAQFRGTNLQIATDRVLEAHGLSEKDIRFIGLDMNAATAALVSSRVDAAFGGAEYLELARKGVVKIIYSTKNDDPTLGRNAALYATAAFEEAHPEETAKVVLAFVRAARFASDEANRDAVFAIWAKSGLPVQSFAEDFKGESLAHRSSPLIDPFVVARYKDQAARAKAYGLIKTDVDIDGWFDTRFLDRALAELKLDRYWPRYGADGHELAAGDMDRTEAEVK